MIIFLERGYGFVICYISMEKQEQSKAKQLLRMLLDIGLVTIPGSFDMVMEKRDQSYYIIWEHKQTLG
jgi:hypothetical protein